MILHMVGALHATPGHPGGFPYRALCRGLWPTDAATALVICRLVQGQTCSELLQ
jgi:hypothetical protein